MKLIVKKKGGYLIATDSRRDINGYYADDNNWDNCEVFHLIDDETVTVAVEGDPVLANAIKYCYHLTREGKKKITYKYLVKEFMPMVYNDMIKRGYYEDKEDYPEFDGNIIVAQKDKCFIILKSGLIEEVNGFEVCGKAEGIAISMLETNKDLDPLKRIMQTYLAVYDVCHLSGGDVVVTDTSISDPNEDTTSYEMDDIIELAK